MRDSVDVDVPDGRFREKEKTLAKPRTNLAKTIPNPLQRKSEQNCC